MGRIRCVLLSAVISMLPGGAGYNEGGSPHVSMSPANELPAYELIAPQPVDETGFDAAIDSQRGGHFHGTHPPSPQCADVVCLSALQGSAGILCDRW